MKLTSISAIALLFPCANAFATMPMGLKCEPKIKIAGAEIGEVSKYQVQKGMEKEDHTALLKRKKVSPVDGCHFTGMTPGQTLAVKYSGEQVGDKEVQCIDLNNNNAVVKFPKSIYTVRSPNMSTYMLMPYCPDGVSKDTFPCSKLNSQSQRGGEYQDTILKWKANDPKTKLFVIDLQFDPPYISNMPPHTPSVPSGAKLFCALINRDGNVIIAGTAQYPVSTPATETTGAKVDTAKTDTESAPADTAKTPNPKERAREREAAGTKK